MAVSLVNALYYYVIAPDFFFLYPLHATTNVAVFLLLLVQHTKSINGELIIYNCVKDI